MFIHFLGICLSATSISPISLFSSSCASPLAALRRSYLLSPRSPLSGRAGSKEQISSSVRATDSGGGFASSLCSHFRFQPSSHLHLKGNQRLSEREKYVNNFSLKKSICLTAWSNALVGYIYLFVFLTFDFQPCGSEAHFTDPTDSGCSRSWRISSIEHDYSWWTFFLPILWSCLVHSRWLCVQPSLLRRAKDRSNIFLVCSIP